MRAQTHASVATRKPTLSPKARAAHRAAIAQQSLMNAISRDTTTNYQAIFDGFAAKGIPLDEIRPRENVFTFDAWRALGRTVRRGEHGVKVITVKNVAKKVEGESGEVTKVPVKKPKTTTVFHISQTDELAPKAAEK